MRKIIILLIVFLAFQLKSQKVVSNAERADSTWRRCRPTPESTPGIYNQYIPLSPLGYPLTGISTIPVMWHIIWYEENGNVIGNVPDSVIYLQMEVINQAFSNSHYTFIIDSIERIENANWAKFSDTKSVEITMKTALAYRPKHIINFYTNDMPGFYGYTYLPWKYPLPADSIMHGIVLQHGSLPGGHIQYCNQGKTAVHELGHFLGGLFHTFEHGCNPPGDMVSDTPYEADGTSGCPPYKDTCPQQGADPIHNYMDYSSDPCLWEFTPGQLGRMDTIAFYYKPEMVYWVNLELVDKNDIVFPGPVARWEDGGFQEYQTPVTILSKKKTNEFLLAPQDTVVRESHAQKFNNWEGDLECKNPKSFFIDISKKTKTGITTWEFVIPIKFKETYGDSVLTVRNHFPAIENNGTIYFKDAWLIDSVDTEHANVPMNRGLDAIFWQRQSPFTPDYSTNFGGVIYQGIFLNQDYNLSPRYYSVRVDSVVTCQVHGQNINFIFNKWTGINSTFKYPYLLKTPVNFLQPGVLCQANYIGRMISDTSLVSNGRQICAYEIGTDTLGLLVYSQEGNILKTEQLSSREWTPEAIISNTGQNLEPVVATKTYPGDNNFIAWTHINPTTGAEIVLKIKNNAPQTIPQSSSPNQHKELALSVTGLGSDIYPIMCWVDNGGLMWWDAKNPLYSVSVSGTDLAKNPQLSYNPWGTIDFNVLVYCDGDIKYTEFNAYDIPNASYAENLSQGLGLINNGQPSICFVRDDFAIEGIIVAWQATAPNGNQNVYILDKPDRWSQWNQLKIIPNAKAPRVGATGANKAKLVWLVINSGGLIGSLDYDVQTGWSSDIKNYYAPEASKVDISPIYSFGDEGALMVWTKYKNPYLVVAGKDTNLTNGMLQSINSGWNLLGLPLDTPNKCYLDLYPNAIPGTLFGWNGTYSSADSLDLGKGYWLRFPAEETLPLPGQPRNFLILDLIKGWNMVSGGVNGNIVLNDVIDPGGIIIPGTLFGYNSAYYLSDSIKQGVGYWLRTSAAGQLNLHCTTAAPSLAKKSMPMLPLEQYPSLTVKDATGANQTLYFNVTVENAAQKLNYSLPPTPPVGAFDARFSGDYRINETDNGVIRVQSLHYPIIIEAQNLPMDDQHQYVIEEVLPDQKVVKHPLIGGKSVEISNSNARALKLERIATVPVKFTVKQNYPNPFNPATIIKYALPQNGKVQIVIYNMLGQKIKTLVNKHQEAGYYEVRWNSTNDRGTPVGSGIYFYRLKAGNFDKTRKMILMK